MSPGNSLGLDKASLEHEIQKAKEMIEDIASIGADVTTAEAILSQAESALANENFEMVQTLTESAISTSTLIKQQYFVQAASILFSSLQRSILNFEGSGLQVNTIKDLYNQAKMKFDNGEYEEAMDDIKSAEDLADELKGETSA